MAAKDFVINRHGRLVFPSNAWPRLDFSVFETVGQLSVAAPGRPRRRELHRWQAALSDQPANDRHRGYGREFRRAWPGGPVFASVHGPDAADGQVRGFAGCERVDWP